MKCHFGATFMKGVTGDPPFLFGFFRKGPENKSLETFDEIMTVGYCLYGLSSLTYRWGHFKRRY